MNYRTKAFAIREFQDKDAVSLARHANNINIWRNVRDCFPHPYTESDALEFVKRVREGQLLYTFAIEIQNQAAGAVSLLTKNDVYFQTAELGYWLAECFWGQGIMTAVVNAAVDWGFRNLNICRIEAQVFAYNPGSVKVLEKNGFTQEARLRKSITKEGRILDAFVYALLREEFDAGKGDNSFGIKK